MDRKRDTNAGEPQSKTEQDVSLRYKQVSYKRTAMRLLQKEKIEATALEFYI